MTKKRNNKNIHILAAAALTAALMAGQIPSTMVWGAGETVNISSLIPDNVTVEQPVPLSDIALPASDYGTLSWVDGSCVPSERVQSYDVVFRPYNTADLAGISGWDGQSDVIYSSVTVVVSSMDAKKDSENSENNQEGDYGDSDSDQSNEQGSNEENGDQEGEITEIPEEGDKSSDIPEENIPEVTETPEENVPEATETPQEEVTETPQPTEDPQEKPTETPEAKEDVETPEETVTETPAASVTPDATKEPESDKDNIFDGKQKKISKDTRPQKAEDNLTDEEKDEIALQNHSCNGISVSGISLPWYVQFRVASGENYEFTNEEAANLFKSYEFELWDTQNNTEYEIPDGEYISVTVPVKAGYDYTIEHLLDSGAMETIVPSVEGSTMVFSTHSFSPFGIAGSKALIGEDIEDKNYGTTDSSDSSQTAQTTTAPAADTSSDETVVTEQPDTSEVSDASDTTGSTGTESESDAENEDSTNSTQAVRTGDNTPIIPFVLLGIAAIAIIGVIVYLRKRK